MRRAALILAATAAVAAPAPVQGADYVGLGDSYSSGTGTASDYADNCQRTNAAYPSLIGPSLPGSDVNLSCSGARTQHIRTDAQTPGNADAQVDLPGLGADTDFVTVQIGGNDAGFVDTLVECGNPFGDCDAAIAEAEQKATVELPPKLDATYAAVRAKAPNATVAVVGYPRIFRPNQTCNTVFSSSEVNDLNAAADTLSAIVKQRAQAGGFAYIDARPVFIGHGACDSAEWINGLSFSQTANSYHPKSVGHSSGYGPLVLGGIQGIPDTTITAKPPSPSNTAAPTFQFTSSVAGVSFQCKLDSGAYTACTSPRQLSGLTEGSHTLTVRGVNAAGNFDQFPASHTWTVDTTAPSVSIDPASGPQQPAVATSSASFAFSTGDPSATLECRVDSGAFAPCASPAPLTGLADGAHSFTVRATDPAGNASTASRSWSVDTTPPQAAVNAGPADPTSASDASIDFTLDDPEAEAECRLDGDPPGGSGWEPCASPAEYTGLAEGEHSFEVRATDAVGNDGDADSYTWTVDASAPALSITNAPDALTNSTAATFAFDVEDSGATVLCTLAGGPNAPCHAPTGTTYAGLADGEHDFTVRATDGASNVASDSHSWTVDTVAPAAAVNAGPPVATSETAAEFAFSSPEPGVAFECRLDSAPSFTACDSPQAYAGLGDGVHTFDVRAVDAADNAGAPASRSWTVDTAPPAAAVGAKPAALTADNTAQFGFTATEPGSTFECRLDSDDPGAFQPCAAPAAYAGLADGSHSFDVRATDAVGNTGAPVSHGWTVDTTAPEVTFDSGPLDISTSGSASFAFHASEPGASFECRLDSGEASAFIDCPSPRSFTSLGEGPHTLEVRATDAVGNTGEAAARSWNVDTLAPNATITSGPQGAVSSDEGEFEFTANEPGDFECRLDSGDFLGCGSPHHIDGLSDGAHTLTMRFTDAGGRSVTDQRSWTVDTVAPAVSISGGPTGLVRTSSAAFTLSVSGGGVGIECRLDGAAFAPCGSQQSFSGLSQGAHVLEARSADAAGNVGTASREWAVDTVAPSAFVSAGPPATTPLSSASIAFGSGDSGAAFQCSLDGAVFASCASPAALSGLAPGDHSFRVRAVDQAGNVGAAATHRWRIEPAAQGEVGGKAKPKCAKRKAGKRKGRKCARKKKKRK